MNIGDKVVQLKYKWGKRSNGSYYTYTVDVISIDNHPFGGCKALDCTNDETGERPLYIPENTYMLLSDLREDKLNQILSDSGKTE